MIVSLADLRAEFRNRWFAVNGLLSIHWYMRLSNINRPTQEGKWLLENTFWSSVVS